MAKHINMVGDPYLVGALGPPAPLNPALMVTQKRSLFHPVCHISLFPSAINMFWLYYNLNHGTWLISVRSRGSHQFRFLVLHPFRSVMSGMRRPLPRATFTVNAALVASQWQHRAWTFPFTQPSTPSTRLDRSQVPFFKSSVWPDRESNPFYQLWWGVLNQLHHLPGSRGQTHETNSRAYRDHGNTAFKPYRTTCTRSKISWKSHTKCYCHSSASVLVASALFAVLYARKR